MLSFETTVSKFIFSVPKLKWRNSFLEQRWLLWYIWGLHHTEKQYWHVTCMNAFFTYNAVCYWAVWKIDQLGQKCKEETMYWKKWLHLVTLHWQEQFKHGCQKARETQLFILLLVPVSRTELVESKKNKGKILKIFLWALQAAFLFISEGTGCLFPSFQMYSMYKIFTNILLPWL